MKREPPIITAAAYSGMMSSIRMAVEYCMNGESNRLPRRSGKVAALSFWPSALVGLPNTVKASSTPTAMFRKANHMRPAPYTAEVPPNPTMAEVLMNVAPYDMPMTQGWTFRPASMKSSDALVRLYPR